METILRAIVEADRAARAETDAARKRREDLSLELSECKKQIDAAHCKKAETAILRARSNMEAKVVKAAEDLDARTEAIRTKLQKTYEDNKVQWVESITDAVIHG